MKFTGRTLVWFYLLCIIIIGTSLKTRAGNIITPVELKWEAPYKALLIDYTTKITVLKFIDNHYDFNKTKLPFYYNQFKLGNSTNYIVDGVLIENAQYVTLDDAELAIFNNSLQQSVQKTYDDIKVQIVKSKKEAYAAVNLFPFRKNSTTGKIEKLLKFNLIVNYSEDNLKRLNNTQLIAANTYSSVLATGKWYKIGLTDDGIYKLSYAFLKSIGIDVKTLNPKNIRLFGNGGGQLPYLNSTPRRDDLSENAIYVKDDGNNGVFDSTDYVLFYGQSQNRWSYVKNASCGIPFVHHVNQYADSTYYFLTVDQGTGKRITPQANLLIDPITNEATIFDDYAYHENDAVNIASTGSLWLGEKIDHVNPLFKFNPPNLVNIDLSSPVIVRAQMVSNNPDGDEFNISLGNNSNTIKTQYFSVNSSDPPLGGLGSGCFQFKPVNNNITLTITKSASNFTGWIDYVEVLARRPLAMSGAQLSFRDTKTVGAGNLTHFVLSTINADITVWDVTDPVNIHAQETEKGLNSLHFNIRTDSLHEFIAFADNNYLTPKAAGVVVNQNLHAISKKDLIIVTHPLFWDEAVALAKMHNEHDALSVAVVTNQQIYNEFSSGAQDASAIRDFMRMLYNRAVTPAELPKYLLLIGDGSFDNKDRLKNNTAFLPTYQTPSSLDPSGSFVSDDFFVQLDDNEGLLDENSNDLPDLAVGRLPVKTQGEAQTVLSKIMRYIEEPGTINTNASSCATGGACTPFGDWRNTISIVSDDGEGSQFIYDCETVSDIINSKSTAYTLDKIYFDAFPRLSTPGGNRFPDVVDAINKRAEKGALYMAYVGHGGEAGLAHERVVTINQINNWKNTCNQPFWITATCEFGRWDDPTTTTGGECVLLNPVGGGIGLFTTVRLIYISANSQVIQNFFRNAFDTLPSGQPQRIGDISCATKFKLGPAGMFRGFSLVCDPALTISYPKHKVVTTAINNKVITAGVADSVSALSQVTIKGEVHDKNGNKLVNFNGLIYPTVYDKSANITTLSNDNDSPPVSFQLQKNVLYKGKASVTNGDFSFTFIVPKDISFQKGNARISYYGHNGNEDAGGTYDNLIISGTNPNAAVDKQGPAVNLFMNDEKFVMGGITDETPKIFAVVSDSNGINAGNGIGHDLVAVLDGKTEAPVILNDYYETEVNSYKKGYIRYPLSKLAPGKHTINMKVWDVYNNSSTSYTEFVVTTNAKLALEHVLNYPNPFTTSTSFYFEHNKPCDRLNVQLQIFTVSGKLVKNINMITQCDGFKTSPINWDGLDDYGDRIARGVYIYRLKVTTPKGEAAEKFEKLVVIK